jgi:hypothetical protein
MLSPDNGQSTPNEINDRLTLAAAIDRGDDLDAAYDAWERSRVADVPDVIRPTSLRELTERHPHLPEILIGQDSKHGLVRRGETMNIIAPPKVGKSWLAYGLALSIATGRDWLEHWPCERGRVLLIDNELMKPMIPQRITDVAEAMALKPGDYLDAIDVVSLRGGIINLNGIGTRIIEAIQADEYSMIILDAWYRAIRSESDHDEMRDAYNMVDRFAMTTGAAWALIHHSTKGNQADRRVTDVGSGAGTQSRAADTHLILREHEDPDCVVLDAAVRSFAPLKPVVLRFGFPVWTVDQTADPQALKRPKTRGKADQEQLDRDGKRTVLDAIESGPQTRRALRTICGMGCDRINRIIRQLLDDGEIETSYIGKHEYIQTAGWSDGLVCQTTGPDQ